MQRGEAAPGDTAAHRAIRIREKRKKILPVILTGLTDADIVYVLAEARGASTAHDIGGTTFTTAQGQPMTFARGPVWVVLAPRP